MTSGSTMSRDRSAKRCSICSTRDSIIASHVTLAALSAAAVSALAPAAAQAVPSSDIIALVNQQRAQNGLPADVRARPEWSDACRRHNDYELAHGGDITHDESDTTSPSYSPEGAFAADNSVLADEDTWTAAGPWFDAPVHRHQFYTPLLTETGVDDHGGLQCAIVGPAYGRVLPADQVWTLPGDAVNGVGASELANEEPVTTNPFVGVATGTRTGPNLLVFTANGPAKITTASLTGADGTPVEVRWVDDTTSTIGDSLQPGGILVPIQPLRDGARYSASVTLTVARRTFTHRWSFATGSAAAPAPSATTIAGADPCPPARSKATKARSALKRARALLRKKRTTARRRRVVTLQRRSRSADRAKTKACGA